MPKTIHTPVIYRGVTYMTPKGSEQHKRLEEAASLYRARDYERARQEFDAALSADPC